MERQTMFWIGRTIIKMSPLLTLTYQFNAVPICVHFFLSLSEHLSDSKVYMEE